MGILRGLAYIILAYTAVTVALLLAAQLTAPPSSSSKSAAQKNARLSQQLSFWGRAAAYLGAMIFCALYGFTASLCLRLAGHGGLSQWTTARMFKYVMYLATGVWFDVVNEGHPWLFGVTGKGGEEGSEGAEWLETRPAVFVGNHQTELDILMLGTMFPKYCSVTAKRSLKWVPFLGQFSEFSFSSFSFLCCWKGV